MDQYIFLRPGLAIFWARISFFRVTSCNNCFSIFFIWVFCVVRFVIFFCRFFLCRNIFLVIAQSIHQKYNESKVSTTFWSNPSRSSSECYRHSRFSLVYIVISFMFFYLGKLFFWESQEWLTYRDMAPQNLSNGFIRHFSYTRIRMNCNCWIKVQVLK